jgi:ribonucleoside-triphosphate reductase
MTSKSLEILSQITIFTKYAKFVPAKKRRENWLELCYRNRDMHLKKYPQLHMEIVNLYNDFVIPKKVLPSMRALQFSGKPIDVSPNRIYNCCFLPVDDHRAFSETMFLLLGGTGVGYSVQNKHIEKLPFIKKPTKRRRFLVDDSIGGWADAVKILMKGYFNGSSLPDFDFSDIRPKGAALVTSGGKAPGPEPLRRCLVELQLILDRKKNGEQLTSLEVHDMMCHIADAVLAGGIRRAAMISLFDMDDEEMLTCKFGNWWESNPQRGRSNNSAVIVRHKVAYSDFMNLWKKIQASGSGEPGFYFTNNADWGTNPCCEIALRPFQMCNLTEINFSDVTSQEDLNERSKAAAFLGTLQAGYTDFHYLRDIWKRTTEKEALLGVSGTGICSGEVLKYDLKEAAEEVKKENARVAKIIGINPAARCTAVKPSGTTSMVLGTSSGIHAWHDPYFIRRMRLGKDEAIYKYLADKHPELVKDEFFRPETQAVVEVPIKAPTNGIFRDESPIDLLERVKKFSQEWIRFGHRKGDNQHNVSATISIKDDEWDQVGQWMYANREFYNGLSCLPYSDANYKQMPFETISSEEYSNLEKHLTNVDLSQIAEEGDNTDLSGEIACSGTDGGCELK